MEKLTEGGWQHFSAPGLSVVTQKLLEQPQMYTLASCHVPAFDISINSIKFLFKVVAFERLTEVNWYIGWFSSIDIMRGICIGIIYIKRWNNLYNLYHLYDASTLFQLQCLKVTSPYCISQIIQSIRFTLAIYKRA